MTRKEVIEIIKKCKEFLFTSTDIFMSKEEIVETLNDFVFGNFEIPMKVKAAINEAVCMLESRDETIDRVLEIIDEINDSTRITFGTMTYSDGKGELINRVLALKGEQE